MRLGLVADEDALHLVEVDGDSLGGGTEHLEVGDALLQSCDKTVSAIDNPDNGSAGKSGAIDTHGTGVGRVASIEIDVGGAGVDGVGGDVQHGGRGESSGMFEAEIGPSEEAVEVEREEPGVFQRQTRLVAVEEIVLLADGAVVLPPREAEMLRGERRGRPEAWLGGEKLVEGNNVLVRHLASRDLMLLGFHRHDAEVPIALHIGEIEGEHAERIRIDRAVVSLDRTENLELHAAVAQLQIGWRAVQGEAFRGVDVTKDHEILLDRLLQSEDGIGLCLQTFGGGFGRQPGTLHADAADIGAITLLRGLVDGHDAAPVMVIDPVRHVASVGPKLIKTRPIEGICPNLPLSRTIGQGEFPALNHFPVRVEEFDVEHAAVVRGTFVTIPRHPCREMNRVAQFTSPLTVVGKLDALTQERFLRPSRQADRHTDYPKYSPKYHK